MIILFEKLKSHLPFSLLTQEEQQVIQENAQIAYYPKETVLIQSQAIPETLFYIIKGIVEARDTEELIDIYHQDDTFGGIELIETVSKYEYTVAEELICYEISKEIFLNLCKRNRAFKEYFFSSIVEHMELLQSRKENAKMAEMMVARVDGTILHDLCIVDAHMPVLDALKKMEQQKAVALLVKNSSGYGIVTDADLRKYILHCKSDDLIEIHQIQTYPMISVYEEELLFNILLLMTSHAIKHMPVLNMKDEPVGILELIDLLSYFSNQTHLISGQLEDASDLQSVINASRRIEMMIKTLHLKGVKSRYIAKLVSEMHKKMYAKLFDLIFPKAWHDHCTLLLLGSEGRGEQLLRTDQDNALIFDDGFDPEDKKVITEQFILALDEIGFPRCQGNVMVINPQWSKTLSSYKREIDLWIEEPSNEYMMALAIFFDTYAVAGNITLFKKLRDHLFKKISEHKTFLPHFAKSIENFESPLGLFSRFVSTDKAHRDEIDIKKGALFGLIHGIRALALEYGITKTNTTQRIKALNDLGYMNKEDATDLIEALEILNTFRLHAQIEKFEQGREIDNYIALNRLSKLEKDTLKEALKSVESFKKRVIYHFHLGLVS